jgi:hypothetical protein
MKEEKIKYGINKMIERIFGYMWYFMDEKYQNNKEFEIKCKKKLKEILKEER